MSASDESSQNAKRISDIEARNRSELKYLREREASLMSLQKEERDRALGTQQALQKIQMENGQKHDALYASIASSNRDRVDKLNEYQQNALREENLRGMTEKQQLAERNTAEKIRLEQRQKEVEANLMGEKERAEIEKRRLNDSKMEEGHRYAAEIKEMSLNHYEEIKLLKKEEETLKSESDALRFQNEEIKARLMETEVLANQSLVTAYNNDVDSRQKNGIIERVKKESSKLLDLTSTLITKIEFQLRKEAMTSRACEIIKTAILKCVTSLINLYNLLESPSFTNMDQLDGERRKFADPACQRIERIKVVINKWATILQDEFEEGDSIQIIFDVANENRELKQTVNEVRDLMKEIPFPLKTHEDFNSAAARGCAAILNVGGSFEQEQRRLGAPSTSQSSISN